MAILKILQFPDKRLATKCATVEHVDDKIRKLLDDMADTMYEAPGIGLAASQVGELVRAIVVDLGPDDDSGRRSRLYKIINPVIKEHDGTMDSEEGCLSIPGIRETIDRFATVVVEGIDENEKPVRIEADGLFAACLQHEIDHINGVLFIDRLSRLKRSAVVAKLKKTVADKKS